MKRNDVNSIKTEFFSLEIWRLTTKMYIVLVKMLACWREIDLFLVYIGLRQIPQAAGNETVSRFFCVCLEKRN